MNELPPGAEDLAEVLTRDLWERIMSGAPTGARPRKAATLILMDRTSSQTRVLMGRRHANQSFMPNVFVFPGGGLEPGDGRMPIAGPLDAITEAKVIACLSRPSASAARALALAAVRETFEETGLLVGTSEYGIPPDPPVGAWSDFASHGVFPSLEDIHYIGRAITPPRLKKRFDAHFFAADASGIAVRLDGMVGEACELVETRWVTFEEARTLGLPLITRVILRELELRLERGMSRFLPVPVYRTGRKGWLRLEV